MTRDKRPPNRRVKGQPKDGGKNPGGRPEEYPESFFLELSAKLAAWTMAQYKQFKRTGAAEIWLGDFAFENGYSIQQLSAFANPDGDFKGKNAKFSQTYAWAKTAQGSWAIKDERINAKIRQLLLVNFHDIKDKVESDVNVTATTNKYEVPTRRKPG
jgi:hypothetical protein